MLGIKPKTFHVIGSSLSLSCVPIPRRENFVLFTVLKQAILEFLLPSRVLDYQAQLEIFLIRVKYF